MGLQSQLHEWVNIGAPKTVLNWIQHGVQLLFISEPPPQGSVINLLVQIKQNSLIVRLHNC